MSASCANRVDQWQSLHFDEYLEETEKELSIFELFGNENLLLNAVFQNTEKEEIMYRHISNENPIPYGMYYKLTDSPEIQNGFFGIPYSN